jgi:hypothetical protein
MSSLLPSALQSILSAARGSSPLALPPLQFSYTSENDCNGLIYALGTANGASNIFSNPADVGLVNLSCYPGLKQDSESLSVFIGRDSARGVVENALNAHFAIDFGSNLLIRPSAYSIRHYNTKAGHALRSWRLEGLNTVSARSKSNASNSGWSLIMEHKNDCSLNSRNSVHTWQIEQKSVEGYNQFRLVTTDYNSSGIYYNLCMAGFELYGSVIYYTTPSPLLPLSSNLASFPSLSLNSFKTFDYGSDFDTQGILYYLGSQGNTKDWINPVDLGLIQLTCTAIKQDSEPLKCFIGRSPGRGVLVDRLNSWFCVDFLGFSVVPTHYTLRHYSSKDSHSLRTWQLQGSNDFFNWNTLFDHIDDDSLQERNSTKTWKLPQNQITQQSYRLFRVILLGLNSSNYYYNVCCAGFEIYGKLSYTQLNQNNSLPALANPNNLSPIQHSRSNYSINPSPNHAIPENSPNSLESPDIVAASSLICPPATHSLRCSNAGNIEKTAISAPRRFEYRSDFDENGILYYLGTRLAPEWINPVELGLVALSSSRLKQDSAGLDVFIGRKSARGVLEDELNCWFSIEFLQHKVALSHYTLRHYSSQNNHCLRHWRIEGSLNGRQWELLREHTNDHSLTAAGSTATFTIAQSSSAGIRYYSHFRFVATSFNSTYIYKNLCCSGLELYGVLTNLNDSNTLLRSAENKSETLASDGSVLYHSSDMNRENVSNSNNLLEESPGDKIIHPFIALDVADLLLRLGLTDYLPIFRRNGVDLQTLLLLDDDSINELVPEVGPRFRLKRWMRQNRNQYDQTAQHVINDIKQHLNENNNNANSKDYEKEVAVLSSEEDTGSLKVGNSLLISPALARSIYKQIVGALLSNGILTAAKLDLLHELQAQYSFSDKQVTELLAELAINEERMNQFITAGRKQDKETDSKAKLSNVKGLNNVKDSTKSQSECIVCMDNVADHLILNCGHLCVCGPCAERVKNSQSSNRSPSCPCCREPITQIKRVYV